VRVGGGVGVGVGAVGVRAGLGGVRGGAIRPIEGGKSVGEVRGG
jgi:hypothetical protein